MIKDGDVIVSDAIINLELRIGTLERAFDFVMKNNTSLTTPSQADIQAFQKETIKDLQAKYPNMGIKAK